LAALGQLALEERQPAAAVQLLEQSVAIAPQQPANQMALAAALTAAGQADLATTHRTLGIKIRDLNNRYRVLVARLASEPENLDVRTEIGLNLMQQDLPAGGAGWLETALQIDPDHPGANRGLASYYELIGQLERADQHRRRAERSEAARAGSKPAAAKASHN
jgi:Tfp pilus assembly protein PilF